MIPASQNPFGINSWSFPLTLTAWQDNSTVSIEKTGNPTVSGLQYRTNGTGWQPYAINTTITLSHAGDYVQFQNTELTLSTSASSYVNFVLSGEIAASGNIQSMLNYRTGTNAFCFYNLFSQTSALLTAPALPALVMAESCYRFMFRICSNLTGNIILPAQTLATDCYRAMFSTTKITSAKLPATTLATRCYYYLFEHCQYLTSLEVNFSDWNASADSTYQWFSGAVSHSGTFTKPTALEEVFSANRIPTGWTVVNK